VRALVFAFAAVLVTCAPPSREGDEADALGRCTGNRTYEREIDLVTPQTSSRAKVRYREVTTQVGRALRVVRTVESIEGQVDPELVTLPEDAERLVTRPFIECPTIVAPRAFVRAEHVRVRDETRLVNVTTTW